MWVSRASRPPASSRPTGSLAGYWHEPRTLRAHGDCGPMLRCSSSSMATHRFLPARLLGQDLFLETLGLIVRDDRLDERVELPLQKVGQPVNGRVDAMFS